MKMIADLLQIVALGTTLIACGCALNGTGFLMADVRDTGTATVVRVHVLGAQVRSRMEDPGLTLGYSARLYVFPATTEPAPGRYWLHVPWPDAAPALASEAFNVGADLAVTDDSVDLAVGVSQRVVLARVTANADVARRLRVDLAHPELISVECMGSASC